LEIKLKTQKTYFKMRHSSENVKLSKWLEKNVPQNFTYRKSLINIIETIAESTIPIRGLLERGITSREIENRMQIRKPSEKRKNIYEEEQIHEDFMTHSIILNALQENDSDFRFIASEEAEPVLGNGMFGISIDPVDGSSNVIVNRTIGTIVGIYNEIGKIICSFYFLYGIFTNLILAINNMVAEFILDNSPYSMTFYHYVFQELKTLPDIERGGIRCLGGDSRLWTLKCQNYEQQLINRQFKDRYSGSFVGDFHAIINYGGVYSYFSQNRKAKIRLYYEWLPLAFIIKILGGEFLIIDEVDNVKYIEDVELLTKFNISKIHSQVCGGLLGNKKAVDLFLKIKG
jgi:fructose-1,6-bisphosphatase I